jgi:hypothetical protein
MCSKLRTLRRLLRPQAVGVEQAVAGLDAILLELLQHLIGERPEHDADRVHEQRAVRPRRDQAAASRPI